MSSSPFEVLAQLHGVSVTMGAILLGSLISVFLSGVVTMQVFLYYRIYPNDHFKFKFLVALIWTLDITHSGMVCGANWYYLVQNFGNTAVTDSIPWEVAASIALTAFLTLFVHLFFAHRIFTLSKKNYFITVPIVVLATCRLGSALVTSSQSVRLKSYTLIASQFNWAFTMGLSLAATVDILIAAALCIYLHRSRTGFSSMDGIIDSITLYTVENGLLTCITTIVSLICWLTMHHNLIWLGLHFAISKLYANAFLATLNARKVLRGRSQGSTDRGGDHAMPVLFPDSRFSRGMAFSGGNNSDPITTKVQVNVEKTIHREGEIIESSDLSLTPSDPSAFGEDVKDRSLAFSV